MAGHRASPTDSKPDKRLLIESLFLFAKNTSSFIERKEMNYMFSISNYVNQIVFTANYIRYMYINYKLSL